MGDCTVIKRVVVSRHTTTVSGMCFEACEIHHTVGCSINYKYVVTDGKRRFFVKTNRPARYNTLEVKARSLSASAAIFDRYDSTPPALYSYLRGSNFAAESSRDPITYDPAV